MFNSFNANHEFLPGVHRRSKAALKAAPVLALVVALLFSVQPLHHAFAQKLSGDDFNQHLIDTSNRTVEILLGLFKPHVEASKRDLLNKDRINVVPLAGFNAYYSPTDKTIQIPLGIVIEIHLQAHAYVYTKNHPASNERYNEWVQYLAERSHRVAERVAQGKTLVDDEPIKDFWRYAELPAPQPLNSEDSDIVATLMLKSLGLILAHEFGHLALNHAPYKDKSIADAQRDEQAADDYGADLARKSLGSTIPGLLTGYIRFAVSEEMFYPFDQDKSTHPRALCRTARMMNADFNQVFKSEQEKAEYFRNAGIPDAVMRQVAEISDQCDADSRKAK